MKKLNFGEDRTKVIKKVLGDYYSNFDRDVNVYELDDKKRKEDNEHYVWYKK